ncbi:MAG TPA: CpaD family pilus assembly protein [Allosphingosinicella sp.]|nr:CpaD family pilus assembly protein [Allosphingosinicella sp.]
MIVSDRKDSFIMGRIKSIAILATLGAAVGGCAANTVASGETNRSLDSLNQPVVQRTDYVLDLETSGGGLAAGERGRLDAWFASLGLGYGDRVWVDDPGGAGPARDHVARVAADYGLLLSDGAPTTAGAVRPGSVRVIVSRSTASVPNCPNWDGAGGASATSPNYGCAMNSNLAAMIADPNDLVLGQAGSVTGDGTTATKAIRVYREAKPTGTKGLSDISTRGSTQ